MGKLLFKEVIYDSQKVSGKTQIKFPTIGDFNEESVTKKNEKEVVKWLINHPSFRKFFLKEFFCDISSIMTFTEITEPLTRDNEKPGDIDLLLVDQFRPDQAITFECKLVKATSKSENSAVVHKKNQLDKGAKQANAYQSLGFYKSYYMVILVDDGRHYKTPNVDFNTTKYNTKELDGFYDLPFSEILNKDVGVVYVNITQYSGKHIDRAGGIGHCFVKHAQPIDQKDTLNNKIKELISRRLPQ